RRPCARGRSSSRSGTRSPSIADQGRPGGGIAVESFPMQADSVASQGPGSAPAGVRQLLDRRQFAEAARVAEALLAGSSEDRDLLYMLAAAQRYLGRISAALATLDRLEE